MKKNMMRSTMAALLGAALGLGGVSVAQAGGGGEYGKHGMMRGKQMGQTMGMQAPSDKAREVRGRIQALKTVEVRGTDQRNVVALIRTRKGNERLVVDLGPQSRLQNVDLQRGDTIAVKGKVAQVQGRLVLVADRARIQGREINIQRPHQLLQYERNLRALSPEQRRQLQRQQQQQSLFGACPMQQQQAGT